MANTADGTSWSEIEPGLADPRYLGQQEIRGLRAGVKLRLMKEHETPATASAGGEHRQGSAKAYRQAAAPTLRPDGATALGADDKGRLWVDEDNGHLFVWSGTAWVSAVAPTIPATITVADLVGAGWTNTTTFTVFANITVKAGAGTIFSLQYDHAGGGFVTVANFKSNSADERGALTCLVAPGGVIKVTNAVAGDISESVYQVL